MFKSNSAKAHLDGGFAPNPIQETDYIHVNDRTAILVLTVSAKVIGENPMQYRIMWEEGGREREGVVLSGRKITFSHTNYPGTTEVFSGIYDGRILKNGASLRELELKSLPNPSEIYRNKFLKKIHTTLLLFPLAHCLRTPVILSKTDLQGGHGSWDVSAAHYNPIAGVNPIFKQNLSVSGLLSFMNEIIDGYQLCLGVEEESGEDNKEGERAKEKQNGRLNRINVDLKNILKLPSLKLLIEVLLNSEHSIVKKLKFEIGKFSTYLKSRTISKQILSQTLSEIKILASKLTADDFAFKDNESFLKNRYLQLSLNGTDNLPNLVNEVDGSVFEKPLRSYLLNLLNQIALHQITLEEAVTHYANNLSAIAESGLKTFKDYVELIDVVITISEKLEQYESKFYESAVNAEVIDDEDIINYLDELRRLQVVFDKIERTNKYKNNNNIRSESNYEDSFKKFETAINENTNIKDPKKTNTAAQNLFPLETFDSNDFLPFDSINKLIEKLLYQRKDIVNSFQKYNHKIFQTSSKTKFLNIIADEFSKKFIQGIALQRKDDFISDLKSQVIILKTRNKYKETVVDRSVLLDQIKQVKDNDQTIKFVNECISRINLTDYSESFEHHLSYLMLSVVQNVFQPREDNRPVGLVSSLINGRLGKSLCVHKPKKYDSLSPSNNVEILLKHWGDRTDIVGNGSAWTSINDLVDRVQNIDHSNDDSKDVAEAIKILEQRIRLAKIISEFSDTYTDYGVKDQTLKKIAEFVCYPVHIFKGSQFQQFITWLITKNGIHDIDTKQPDFEPTNMGQCFKRLFDFVQFIGVEDLDVVNLQKSLAEYTVDHPKVVALENVIQYQGAEALTLQEHNERFCVLRDQVFPAYVNIAKNLKSENNAVVHLKDLLLCETTIPGLSKEEKINLSIEELSHHFSLNCLSQYESVHVSKRPFPKVPTYDLYEKTEAIDLFLTVSFDTFGERVIKIDIPEVPEVYKEYIPNILQIVKRDLEGINHNKLNCHCVLSRHEIKKVLFRRNYAIPDV